MVRCSAEPQACAGFFFPARGRGPPPPPRHWAGGKGRTKEGNRTGQTARAGNGAERRRRRRKGKTGKNHLWLLEAPVRNIIPRMHTPSALKSVLESANPRTDSGCASGCPWSTARATAPSPGRPTPGVVKQDKSSGGSVDTKQNTFGPTEGQNEQWREASRRRQRQTIRY